MKYVDGFVIAVPEKNLPVYREMAEMAGKVWKKHGALEVLRVCRRRPDSGDRLRR